MTETLQEFYGYFKSAATLTTMAVFIISGLYLLVIDGLDLKNKGLKKELTVARIVGLLYIFGSMIVFIIFKYIL
ncbi:MAG TPA: hypothetical protein GXX35_05745 [Thermoanaerobacterales bacterium]|nr:hypothetical protein [Thermoanaerobacterales bacterium]